MTAPPSPLADHRDAWQHHATRIMAIRDEVTGVRTYDLVFRDSRAAARYEFAPGQFNMLYLPGIGEAAISISSDPADHSSISHTVKAVGNVTDALARLGVGDEVILRGPFGTPWPLADLRGHDIVIRKAVAAQKGIDRLRTGVHVHGGGIGRSHVGNQSAFAIRGAIGKRSPCRCRWKESWCGPAAWGLNCPKPGCGSMPTAGLAVPW